MNDILSVGQWQGYFKYGPEYGDIVEGCQAEFRLFVEEYKDGQFSGRIIDWEGMGADGEVAYVKGFVTEGLISFTKQYFQMHTIDEWGSPGLEENLPGHQVVYEGKYDPDTNGFMGTWEIVTEGEHTPEVTIEYLMKGTWTMHGVTDCA